MSFNVVESKIELKERPALRQTFFTKHFLTREQVLPFPTET